MKKILALCILCTSCMSTSMFTTIISEDDINQIPINANKIIVQNSIDQASNYTQSYKALLAQDYHIEFDNKEQGYISASKQDIKDTYVRLNITCLQKSISITSEWKAGSQSEMMAQAISGVTLRSTWQNAKWTKTSDKQSVSFANAVKFSKALEGEIKYITPTEVSKAKSSNSLSN